MSCKIKNRSNLDMARTSPMVKSLYSFAQKKIGFDKPAHITFLSDAENASQDLGKTGCYQPQSFAITIYTDKRHIKDVLRSVAHELVHHHQNCCGELEEPFETGPGYAQKDDRLRGLEKDAYKRGNMIFRDWEDTYKQALNETNYYRKETPKMSNTMTENQLRKMIRKVLQEKFTPKVTTKPGPAVPVEVVTEEKVSNDEWYGNSLYESLKKEWTK